MRSAMAARRSHELQAGEELGDLFSAVAFVLDGPARWPRRRAAHGEHALASSGRADVARPEADRKSTRLNSSHGYISYAVFCLKKKKGQKVDVHIKSKISPNTD